MKYTDKHELKQSLKRLDGQLKWDDEGKERVRRNITTVLNERRKSPQFNRKKRVLFPVVSTMVVFFVLMMYMYDGNKSISQSSNTILSDNTYQGQQFQVGVDIEQSRKIQQLRDSGFEMVVPELSPKKDTKLENIHHKEYENYHAVYAQYYSEEKPVFSIHQEKLENNYSKEQALKLIEQRNDTKEIEKIKIGSHDAIIHYTSDQGESLNEIWIATDDYFYSIGAHFLSKEELINVASTMDFK